MWYIYLLITLAVIGLVFLIYLARRKKLILEPAPEQDYLVVNIENNTDNIQKVYTLEDNQIVVIFKSDSHLQTIDNNEFSISTFALNNQINIKDYDFKSYHFYIFNQSMVVNIPLKIQKPIRITDIEYGIPISIIPKARISFEHTNIPILFDTFNLYRKKYSYANFYDDLRIHLEIIVARGIIQFCNENNVSFIVLNYYIDDIEKYIKKEINDTVSKYGLRTTKLEFIDFTITDSNELKKLDSIMLQKQKYTRLKYSYIDEKKKQLMDNIDFHQKAIINKQHLSEEVKKII